ncbi:cytochrome P450 [Stachybotrys elegans]|uniref:Cytochrome P450 n=1 Tax=Stachybotrys elegans TaxID=80388 RepID=A0A8K0WKZ4_9HYPO|nr:cytochrome P450 [Stachybotrys elegans]
MAVLDAVSADIIAELAAVVALAIFARKWTWADLAKAKKDFIARGADIIDEGYYKYKDDKFWVQTADMPRLVLSRKFIPEINNNKMVPDGTLSLTGALKDRLLTKYTDLTHIFESPLHNDVCKIQLTQHLHKLIPGMHEETEYWISQKIGDGCETNAYDVMVTCVVGIISRVYAGTGASRDPEWLKTARDYSISLFAACIALRPYPAFIRGWVAPYMETQKKLKEHLDTAKRQFSPIFAERLRLADAGLIKEEDKPNDMVQWMVDAAKGDDRDPDRLSHNLLFLTVAAIHTSAAGAVHALFDLCGNPEYIEPLREEIRETFEERGITMAAWNQMKRLDSVMKESQRINHPGVLSFNRKVEKPLHLSDGTTIPAGTMVTIPSSSIARDPDIYPNPEKFLGFRFYELRMAKKENAMRYQYTSTGPDSMQFGHGKLACPGRHVVGAVIKDILAEILLKYDVSWPAGTTQRPKNVFSGEHIGPDRSQKIVFTKRVADKTESKTQ